MKEESNIWDMVPNLAMISMIDSKPVVVDEVFHEQGKHTLKILEV